MINSLYKELEKDIKRFTDSSSSAKVSVNQIELERIYRLEQDSTIDQSELAEATQKLNFYLDEFYNQTNLEDLENKTKNIINALEEIEKIKNNYYSHFDFIEQKIIDFTFNKIETETLFWQGLFSISVAHKSETLDWNS